MAADLKTLKDRAQIIAAIRRFFASRDFIEVETPALVPSPGMEPHLLAFRTEYVSENGRQHVPLYLPTSPEFHMKRLLCRGAERIYQLARSFRNGETGDLHQPEFCMLEWYRAHADYTGIMNDTETMVAAAAGSVHDPPVIRIGDRSIDLSPPWERLTVAEAWERFTGINLKGCPSHGDLLAAGREIGVRNLRDTDPRDVLYFKIFLERIEPHLGRDRPVILYEYPADMAALARLKPGDPSVALRFEVYIAGIELANAFDELTDPDVQLQRCRMAQEIQRESGREPFPVDTAFIGALQGGMPPAAGIALGVDRLIMLILGKSTIHDVIAFPFDGI